MANVQRGTPMPNRTETRKSAQPGLTALPDPDTFRPDRRDTWPEDPGYRDPRLKYAGPLQRIMDFGAAVSGMEASTSTRSPASGNHLGTSPLETPDLIKETRKRASAFPPGENPAVP